MMINSVNYLNTLWIRMGEYYNNKKNFRTSS